MTLIKKQAAPPLILFFIVMLFVACSSPNKPVDPIDPTLYAVHSLDPKAEGSPDN